MTDIILVVIAIATVASVVLLVILLARSGPNKGDAHELRRELSYGLDRGR